MKTIKIILQVIVDIAALAMLLLLIFGGIWFRVIRIAADVIDECPQRETWILIDKRAKSLTHLERGNVVLFRRFADSIRTRLGKTLAFPGDTVCRLLGSARRRSLGHLSDHP